MATSPSIAPSALPYGLLKRTHRDYDGPYWRELRVLYEGGKRLLADPEILRSILIRYVGETEAHYVERLKRAFYINILAAAIDYIVAGLSLDPIKMVPPEGPEAEVDEFYAEFFSNTAPPGSDDRVPLQELVREQGRDGLLLGRWWTLVDLPPTMPAASEAEQRELGALEAYACPVRVEEMLDWSVKDGKLQWAIRCQRTQERTSPSDNGATVVETYTVYTVDSWWQYVVTYTDEKMAKNGVVADVVSKPKDEDLIEPGPVGKHSFGRVPAILHVLPVGLWAGNKLCSIVKEHFNKSNALAWAECKDLFSQLYEFLGGEIPGVDVPISEAQADPSRAKNQRRGPGLVQTRGKDDRAEYVGPDTSGFAQARESVKAAREDAFRVVYQMALAEDNKGALVGRSAESKGKDHAATGVVLGAVGEELREHAVELLDTVSRGRGDEPGWTAQGLERFEVSDVSEQIDQAAVLENVSIPSATYQVERKLRLAKSDLGAAATDELVDKIRKDLEGAITQDTFEMAGMLPPGEDAPVPGEKPVPGGPEKPVNDEQAPPAKRKTGAKR
jgi:hypothetical protein